MLFKFLDKIFSAHSNKSLDGRFYLAALELNQIDISELIFEIDGLMYLPMTEDVEEVRHLVKEGSLRKSDAKFYLAGEYN